MSIRLARLTTTGKPCKKACTRPSRRGWYSTYLPVETDLLDRYRGLVALGKVQYDEEQIRLIMQLRRLQKDIDGYAPPAVIARHLNRTHALASQPSDSSESAENIGPWWTADDDISSEDGNTRSLVRVRTHAEEIEALTTPKGLLITGPPGSGKSFLIDLWFSTLPTPYKARKHYNELVLEIYRAVWEETRRRMAAMHSQTVLREPVEGFDQPWNKFVREQWRQLLNTGALPIRWRRKSNMSFSLSSTPLEPSIAYVVARRLILRHWLLVFDEIQLLDVSSATLLADVLSWFWRMGGIVVGSSNKVPDDLYKNGVQRERLEPFVEALKARCPVVLMRSEHDWRAVKGRQGKSSWYTFTQRQEFEAALADLKRGVHGRSEEASPSDIIVFGRSIRVPWAANGVCEFDFSQLCNESLGPADYITLASRYHTFVITSIPVLKLSAKNEARRFISLVDALYEARCRIVCLAEAPPEQLFFPDASTPSQKSGPRTGDDMDVMMAEAVGETQDIYRPNVSSYDAPNMAQERVPSRTLALDTLSIFSGKDEQFAFKRALSRLQEMASEGYARDEQWAPLPPDARKWEFAESTPSIPPARHSSPAQGPPPDMSDFAEEATLHPRPSTSLDRPPALHLSADHIWGVREDWGERARDWGRGAAIYPRTSSPRSSSPSTSTSSSASASSPRTPPGSALAAPTADARVGSAVDDENKGHARQPDPCPPPHPTPSSGPGDRRLPGGDGGSR